MNRKELIDALASKTDCTKACADRTLAALIEVITATLKKGPESRFKGPKSRAPKVLYPFKLSYDIIHIYFKN